MKTTPNVYQYNKEQQEINKVKESWLFAASLGWKNSAWWMCLLIILPLAFALKYKLAFNMTPSLKFKVAIIEKGVQPTNFHES